MKVPTFEERAYMESHATDDRQPWFIGVNAACLVIALAAVGLRFCSRRRIGASLGLDDWLIFSAVGLLAGHVICLLIGAKYGMGRHIIFVTNKSGVALASLAAQTFYTLSIAFIKFSILCLYQRIFQRARRWFSPTLCVTATVVLLYTIPQCFAYLFQCVPIESLWSELGPGMRVVCIDFHAVIMAFGIINILTDWFILALPIPIVIGLQLERRTKWSISSLFLVGSVVCIVSIVRLIYARRVEGSDTSWNYVPISTISTIECTAGILAACLPTWRPCFNFLHHGITDYLSGDQSSRGQNSENLQYGNNIAIGRGRWPSRGRGKSRSRSRVRSKIEQGTAKMGFKSAPKRSETSMSGESLEKILRTPLGASDIELASKRSPTLDIDRDRTPTPFTAAEVNTSRDMKVIGAGQGGELQESENTSTERGRRGRRTERLEA